MASLATIPYTSTLHDTWLTWRNALPLQSQSSVTQSMYDVIISFSFLYPIKCLKQPQHMYFSMPLTESDLQFTIKENYIKMRKYRRKDISLSN